MELVLATVSTTLGPEWAELINEAFTAVDLHDHSEGKGVPVTPSGLNINADLDFKNNRAVAVGAASLRNLASADTANLGSLQRVGPNLFWVSGAGSAVQITSGSSVNSPGTGQLSVDAPASYPYSITSADSETVLVVDTTAARTLSLPSATVTMTVVIKDGNGQAQTNPITIEPDGTDTIEGVNADYVIDWNNASIWLISDGTSKWHVV